MKYRLNDHGPAALRAALRNQGWKEWTKEDGYDCCALYWKNSKFTESEYAHRSRFQRLNHFPGSVSICVKDSLARLMRANRLTYGSLYSFVPETFILPMEQVKFCARHARLAAVGSPPLWICKPSDKSRGRNIYLMREPTEVAPMAKDGVVIQRYIDRPLLLGDYKFDMRIYVLVTSMHPLSIYIYKEGLARMATQKYDNDHHRNLYSHLTNASINKHSPTYRDDKETIGSGCKWSLQKLWSHLAEAGVKGFNGDIGESDLWQRIKVIVVSTLLTLPMRIPATNATSGCFELYGFDIMVDETCRPWLLEVNSSPSLGIDCKLDSQIKVPMLESLLQLISMTSCASPGGDTAQGSGMWRPGTAPVLRSVSGNADGMGLSVTGRNFKVGQHVQVPATSEAPRITDRPRINHQLRRPATRASRAVINGSKASSPKASNNRLRSAPVTNRQTGSSKQGQELQMQRTLPWARQSNPNAMWGSSTFSRNSTFIDVQTGDLSAFAAMGALRPGTASSCISTSTACWMEPMSYSARPMSSSRSAPAALDTSPVDARLPASGYAARSRLKSLPESCGEFERIFPFNNLTADLAIHLKPAAGGREPVHIIRRVVRELQNLWN